MGYGRWRSSGRICIACKNFEMDKESKEKISKLRMETANDILRDVRSARKKTKKPESYQADQVVQADLPRELIFDHPLDSIEL
jgi:cytochrome c553